MPDSPYRPKLRLLKPPLSALERRTMFWVDRPDQLVAYSPEELLSAFERGEVDGQSRVRIKPEAPSKPLRRYIRELVWLAYRSATEQDEETQPSRFEEAFDRAPIGMILSDLAGRIEHTNEAFCQMLGYTADELRGMRVGTISAPEGREQELVLGNQVLSGERSSFEIEKRFIARSGDSVQILLSISMIRDAEGQPSQVVAHVLDLTRRKRLESELAQADRLKSIGKLAGGIAHDFNNILQVFLGVTATLSDGTELERVEAIAELELAAESGARLTRQLMAFARQGVVRVEQVDLNQHLEDLQPMIRAALGRRSSLVLDLAPHLVLIEVDPLQLEQAVMNLAFNSAKAMSDGGVLTIQTREIPDGRVALTTRDTGAGMDPETCARAFEPYFTTRKGKGGTGLGLAMVHGIVTRFGGSIRLDSRPGAGTTCTILWPRSRSAKVRAGSPVSRRTDVAPRSLIVDDERAILRIVGRVLERSGHTIATAASVSEALAIIGQAREPFELLVCDVCLQDGKGPEVVAAARRRWPDLAVLYISGFTGEVLDESDLTPGQHELLAKPFLTDELLARVQALLNR